MGLKTTNYKLKTKNNYVLPNAYAYIVKCHSERTTGYADIGIFADRESAVIGSDPFEIERVHFTVDRNENDRVTAYKEATAIKTTEIKVDGGIEKRITEGKFVGWTNDIVNK